LSDSENKVADQDPPPRTQQPPPAAAAQPPVSFPQQPQQIACLTCNTVVAAGTAFCPQCGSPIPNTVPPVWPIIPPVPRSKRNTTLIVGIVLIAIIVIGVGGYALYQSQQQLVLQASKNSEKDAANQSVNQLQSTCFSNSTDVSNLSYNFTSRIFSGYMVVYETFGISNPTRFAIDATWSLTFDFTGPQWVLTDTQTFYMSANGVGYPRFAFRVTSTQLNSLTPATDLKTYTARVDSNYQITGTYATYTVTQHQTYDSSSNTGSGTIGSSGSVPKC
jgi:hypothetical protein